MATKGAQGGTCRTLFMKQVLPRLDSPRSPWGTPSTLCTGVECAYRSKCSRGPPAAPIPLVLSSQPWRALLQPRPCALCCKWLPHRWLPPSHGVVAPRPSRLRSQHCRGPDKPLPQRPAHHRRLGLKLVYNTECFFFV